MSLTSLVKNTKCYKKTGLPGLHSTDFPDSASYRRAKYQQVRKGMIKKQNLYVKTPRGSYNKLKAETKTRKREFSLSFDNFMTFWQKSCSYCGEKISVIGLDRVDNEVGYTLDNVVSCCFICNRAKNNLPLEVFIDYLNRVHDYVEAKKAI